MDGRELMIEIPRVAQEHGIGTTSQELSLAGVLSVVENSFPGDLPTRHGMPWRVDWPAVWSRSSERLDRVGCRVRPQMLVRSLSVAVLMISSELPEILGMSHQVFVMRGGRIGADIPREDATGGVIMGAATGQRERAGAQDVA